MNLQVEYISSSDNYELQITTNVTQFDNYITWSDN